MRDVRLLTEAFAVGPALEDFARANPDAGGAASFTGQVRPDGGVTALELTHYAPLTLPAMEQLAHRAQQRFDLGGVLAWHRIGSMVPGDPIVLVAAAAKHRRDAIQAVDFLMDHLKSAAWFWKREHRSDGWHWIEPRGEDYADLARWEKTGRI